MHSGCLLLLFISFSPDFIYLQSVAAKHRRKISEEKKRDVLSFFTNLVSCFPEGVRVKETSLLQFHIMY